MADLYLYCLFAGTILGQEKINSGLKNKTDTETQLHFKDAFVFKHIRLATSQFSVHQSMPSVAALEGKLDYKLSPASDKKYFILVFYGWKGDEYRYAPAPVLILDTARLSNSRNRMDFKTEKSKIEKYSTLIKKRMNDSYFKNDPAALSTFSHVVDGAHQKIFFDEHLYRLGIGGYHPQVTVGILDASSILRFNIRNNWLPLSRNFFDQNRPGQKADLNEENIIENSTGYSYKFILFSLTDNEVYESGVIENAYYTLSKNEVQLIN